jgi:hypothetical protein
MMHGQQYTHPSYYTKTPGKLLFFYHVKGTGKPIPVQALRVPGG